jgi:hypothetical protein
MADEETEETIPDPVEEGAEEAEKESDDEDWDY